MLSRADGSARLRVGMTAAQTRRTAKPNQRNDCGGLGRLCRSTYSHHVKINLNSYRRRLFRIRTTKIYLVPAKKNKYKKPPAGAHSDQRKFLSCPELKKSGVFT